ncbi:hypothetical protein ENUP19_0061G0098 [Entamoeba nuttalli]|uniref:Glucosamine 6-phosphate N-acetyltransferase n=2 Tax=Entamoeba nuttalli TaxID=412467 RepID=K2HC15_ENTNP|nr:glucosamine 6-phosphate N-acetyltransferase, putative [Entamoeba nuttalli P19]EKE40209.1 glucosamine 6-phosphate N-acetyltransferase, putative [Entamoeba nuttalli P19]|eukprot:XP_008857462.1 glucosamine 6-phosphate N-acetyltransferase, putative [Entamoeba nuttalli P19]
MNSIYHIKSTLPIINYIRFRCLEREDYHKGVIQVLNELSNCQMDKQKYEKIFDELKETGRYVIVVGEDEQEKIVCVGTLFIERKFIWNGGLVGHIEDIGVTQSRRNQGIGKGLIDSLLIIGKDEGCCRIILDCKDRVKGFYEKCGMTYKDNCMAIYLNK